MSSRLLALVLAALAVASAEAVTFAAEPSRHTGTVVAVQSDHKTLVLDEMGPWTGPASRPTRLSIALTPDTVVTLATRAKAGASAEWPGSFAESTLAATEIRPGDSVTVIADSRQGRLVARSIVVVRQIPGVE
jgi:hypothetical protein